MPFSASILASLKRLPPLRARLKLLGMAHIPCRLCAYPLSYQAVKNLEGDTLDCSDLNGDEKCYVVHGDRGDKIVINL